jgi:GTP-binding protein
LLHVVDCATAAPGRDPVSDVEAVERELAQYVGTFGDLLARPRLVALNKIDVPEAAELAALVRPEFEDRGLPVFDISAATHAGLSDLAYALAGEVEADRAGRPRPEPARIVLHPQPVDAAGFTIDPDPAEPGGFVVHGSKPERWVQQTNFDNDEAVGYLADRLARLGVETELTRLGAEVGAAVTIGDVTFDFHPAAGDEVDLMPGRRGTDPRLETSSRPGAATRLAAKRARRVSDGSAPEDSDDDGVDAESGVEGGS